MPENNRKMQTDISELENGQLAEQQLPSDFTLVVLAGGASSHMGREKSDLLLDGQTFLEIQIGINIPIIIITESIASSIS